MKTKLLAAALLISVGFNLFFLTGYFKARHRLSRPHTLSQRIEAAGKQLGLDSAQQARLMEIFHTTQEKQKKLKRQQRALTRDFIKELRKDHPDISSLKSKLRSLRHAQQQLRRFAKSEWKNFMSSLSPSQRDAVIRLIKRRPDLYRKLLLKSAY